MRVLTILAVVAALSAATPVAAEPVARFTGDGALERPGGYREWVFIGATVQPKDINYSTSYAPGIKHTYLDRASFADWKETGTFRVGAVIVQERVEAERAEFMNAEGYFAGRHVGLQVMVKDPERFPDTIWGFFSFGKPPYPEKVWPVPGMGELDCAGCHTYADQDWVFTRFYPTLTAAAPEKLSKGQQLYERDWTPATAAYDDTGDGLGPLFQARSCDACHPKGDRGTFKIGADGVIDGDSYVVKIGAGKYGDPVYGGLIQSHGIAGVPPEGRIAVRFETVTDPTGTPLRKPVFDLRDAAYGAPDPATTYAGRLSPAVFGNGALERVPLEVLERLTDPDDRDGDGISGRLNLIELPFKGPVAGRFGWKAAQWTLEVQTAKAFRMEMGLSTRLMGPAWGDCTAVQKECHDAPTGERPAKGGREVDMKAVELVTAHVASLPPPARRGDAPDGEALFKAIGCAACHAPELPLEGGGTVGAFTDLLLHDLGQGLADGFEEGSAMGSEWRTAPLMGLGSLLEKKMPLLHDGRARDAHEAILWHGGEGAAAAQAYRELDAKDRHHLMSFLETL